MLATMEAAVAYLLFLPLVTCAVLVLLLLLSALVPSKAKTSGVLLPLPPSPPAVPVVGPLLWLVRARNSLEPAIRELHRRHGPVLTLRFLSPRPAIFVSGRGATHRALVGRGPAFASRPPAIAPFRVLTSGQTTVSSAPYGPLWRSLRRNLTSGVLSPSRAPLFAPARRRALAALVSDLGRRSEESSGEAVAVAECIQRAMFSLLTHVCFGRRLHDRRVGEVEAVQRELFASYISFQVFAFCPAVTKRVFWRRWRKVLSIRRRQEELFLPLIRARRDRDGSTTPVNGGEHERDESLPYCYVDTLLAHRLPKEEGERALTDAEMVSLCTEFLTASVDTTVTALQWIMANLVRQPELQAKLLDEINAVVTDSDEDDVVAVAEADLKSMPYLKAVVLEGLRRHPPAHFLLSHAAVEETSLDGYRVPAATPVNFSVADVSLDEAVWDRPEEFRPERFLDGGEGVGVDLTGSREIMMMPFGAGRRICPGLGLALLNLEYFVANMVREFEWGAVAGDGVDLAERPEFTVTMERPLRARVARRRLYLIAR
jgi:cytochrome P450